MARLGTEGGETLTATAATTTSAEQSATLTPTSTGLAADNVQLESP